ncbi:MAG: transglycosylase SLT domain-containing protein [Candidatus Eisenbacteria bacterium]
MLCRKRPHTGDDCGGSAAGAPVRSWRAFAFPLARRIARASLPAKIVLCLLLAFRAYPLFSQTAAVAERETLASAAAAADSIVTLERLIFVAQREGDLETSARLIRERRASVARVNAALLPVLRAGTPELLDAAADVGPYLLETADRERTLDLLLSYLSVVPAHRRGSGELCLVAGLLLKNLGRHREAARYFERASRAPFGLSSHALCLAVESTVASQDVLRLLELKARLDVCGAPRPLLARARLAAARELAATPYATSASELLDSLTASDFSARERTAFAYSKGLVAENTGNLRTAAGHYLEAFDSNQSSAEAVLAARSYVRLAEQAETGRHRGALLLAAQCLVRSGARAEGERLLEGLFRDGKGFAQAGWELGRLHHRTGKYAEAEKTFRRLRALERTRGEQDRASLWIARCVRDSGRGADAMALFRKIDLRRESSGSAEAAWELGMELEGAGRLRDAAGVYGALRREFPSARIGQEALWRSGFCEYRQGAKDTARATFAQAARVATEGWIRDMALFWELKCRFELGDSIPAGELSALSSGGDSLYGMLLRAMAARGRATPATFRAPWDAGCEGGVSLGRSEAGPATSLSPGSPGDGLAGPFDEGLGATLSPGSLASLVRFGLDGFVREGLRLARREARGDTRALLLVAQSYWRAGLLREALLLSGQLLPEEGRLGASDRHFLRRMLYPVFSPDLLLESSKAQGVSPFLILAVMRRESMFDPEAVSRAGAVGLMQMLPSTAREVASYLGHDAPSANGLKSPEISIRYGTWLLGRLKGRFSDRVEVALAAYNAGEHNAERWLKRPGSADGFVFMESISFRETREYVRGVLGDVHAYAGIYDRR